MTLHERIIRDMREYDHVKMQMWVAETRIRDGQSPSDQELVKLLDNAITRAEFLYRDIQILSNYIRDLDETVFNEDIGV